MSDTNKPQAGAQIESTPEMIAAGVKAYEAWEPDHIFDDQGGAADYAKRELVADIFCVMESARYSNEQETPKA